MIVGVVERDTILLFCQNETEGQLLMILDGGNSMIGNRTGLFY